MSIGLIITAAGQSRRFGQNKQFVTLNGQPLIATTCLAFSGIPQIDTVVITAHEDDCESMRSVLSSLVLSYNWTVVPGDRTRALSVQAGVNALPEVSSVMVHDGARPFVSQSFILKMLKAGRGAPALIPVLPIRDTLKVIENGLVVETVDRSKVRAVQTPQLIQYELLKEAYDSVDIEACTDEASIMEALGVVVRTMDGDPRNVKVTYPEDLSGVA